MKKLLKMALAALMSLSVLAGCSSGESSVGKTRLEQIKERGYIVLGTSPDYAPNEFYISKDGKKQIVGSDIALAQAIADELGVELKIQESDFTSVITNVQSGNVDMGISGFAWKKDRAEVVNFSTDYSRESGEHSYQGLMVRKADYEKFLGMTKEEVKKENIKVGAQMASIQYDMALQVTDEKNIVSLGETTACASLLATGDIDAFVCTSTQALALMETFDNIILLPDGEYNMDAENFYDRTGAIVMKDASTDSLLEIINKVIEKAKVKGDNGLSQLDVWADDAKALMPFELDESILSGMENSGDYNAGLNTEKAN